MSVWDKFTYVKDTRAPLAPGRYRCRIESVEQKESGAGNDMLVIALRISGFPVEVKYHLVANEYRDENESRLLDAFPSVNMNPDFRTWPGAVGACVLRRDDRDDRYMKVHYFLRPEQAEELPPFCEVERGERPASSGRGTGAGYDSPGRGGGRVPEDPLQGGAGNGPGGRDPVRGAGQYGPGYAGGADSYREDWEEPPDILFVDPRRGEESQLGPEPEDYSQVQQNSMFGGTGAGMPYPYSSRSPLR